MLNGDDFWPGISTEELVGCQTRGAQVRVFGSAPQSVFGILSGATELFAERLALEESRGRSVTYRELLSETEKCGQILSDAGVKPGMRVGLLLENSIEFVVAFFAVNMLGATLCPLPGKYRIDEIRSLISRADIRFVICEDEFVTSCMKLDLKISLLCRSELEKPYLEIDNIQMRTIKESPDAVALLMSTSGTTAKAKQVLLTNQNIVHATIAYQKVLELSEKDSSIIAVPMYHITGMVAIICTMSRVGGTLYIQRRLVPDEFLKEIEERNISYIHASPTVFKLLLTEREQFPSLPSVRMLACGAAHMPTEVIKALHDWMPQMEFRTVYGLTETSSPGTIFPNDAATSKYLGSSGIPIPGMRVDIRDATGSSLPNNEKGEIWVTGTNVCAQYGDDAANRSIVDGWLRTGDIGYTTSSGYLYVVGRTKDMVNRGGEKVWCVDVEEALCRVNEVIDACVVALPDHMFGEVPGALVVLSPGSVLQVDDIKGELRSHIATFEVPAVIKVDKKIPLTAGLKVDKKAVRAILLEEMESLHDS